MPQQSDLHRDLQLLEADLRRLEAEYNMFFSNRLPRPPWETRKRVETIIKRWDPARIETTVDRFRFSTFLERYASFTELWDRALRAREEGRPGPLNLPEVEVQPSKNAPAEQRVLCVTTFSDPKHEPEKLHSLYESLMDARHEAGETRVPFDRFVVLVTREFNKLRSRGSTEAAFRVVLKDGKVTFTVRGLKGENESG
ncbi:MAG: hypothetical protein HYX76_03705 [Acidobacteria bacterium]|nr:hypothetical protein [Acidobacteriota bacterium]